MKLFEKFKLHIENHNLEKKKAWARILSLDSISLFQALNDEFSEMPWYLLQRSCLLRIPPLRTEWSEIKLSVSSKVNNGKRADTMFNDTEVYCCRTNYTSPLDFRAFTGLRKAQILNVFIIFHRYSKITMFPYTVYVAVIDTKSL